MTKPVASASRCNSAFHTRLLALLLPPESAVTKSCSASGYRSWPIFRHQVAMLLTAKTVRPSHF